jgi:hypothetical protein
MLPLALATVVALEFVKTVLPPLTTWAKFAIAAVLTAAGSFLLDLDLASALGAWGLSHLLHAGVRVALAVSDYYRVETVLRSRTPRTR